MTSAQRPGLLALTIAGLAVAWAAVSALLAWRSWQLGVPEVPDLESAASTVQTLLQAGCAVLTLVWLARGLAHVRQDGAEGLSVGPLGAVLWWFVPIANLVMPVKAFGELRKAAIRPSDWQAVDGSFLIGLWWATWLLTGLANVAFLRASTSDDAGLATIAGSASFASDLLGTPTALLFAMVVLTIDRHLQATPQPEDNLRTA